MIVSRVTSLQLHAPAIFLGSFLLFLIQPLIGRYILPWFGGSPSVWTTCMLFFQVMLLVGYAYAHLATIFNRRRQGFLHLTMLAIALAFLPIVPSTSWHQNNGTAPIATILLLLLATIGAPYLTLSATAPLVQHWFVRDHPDTSPYRLYALSNTASLLGLIGYPLLAEPFLTLNQQVMFWSGGFALYALLCSGCALISPDNPAGTIATGEKIGKLCSGLSVVDPLLWFCLSAAGSALLLATTNQLCQDVASIPFLWVAPLFLYLATFIVCFGRQSGYHREIWNILLAGMVVMACRTMAGGTGISLPLQIIIYLATLLAACMVCHGELVRWRPPAENLTAFYLVMATGGASGGLAVALLAPLSFSGFWEYPVSLTVATLVIFISLARDGAPGRIERWLPKLAGLCLVGLAIFSWFYIRSGQTGTEYRTRNFYGMLKIIQDKDSIGKRRSLIHGHILHGTQYLDDPARRQPTMYYGPDSGVGLVMGNFPRHGSGRGLKVGIIGLGTGTLAAYGRQGDIFRFYEINPTVINLAKQYFTFLTDSKATIQLVTGDARLMLERELTNGNRQQFDILVVDAFSSDAVPVHLLTAESLSLYDRHLAHGGVIIFHATNRYLDLLPVMRTLGESGGFRTVLIRSAGDLGKGTVRSNWVIMGRADSFVSNQQIAAAGEPMPPAAPRPWTDNYASLLPLIKW